MKRSIGLIIAMLVIGSLACTVYSQATSAVPPSPTVGSATATNTPTAAETALPATVQPTNTVEPTPALPTGWLTYQDTAHGFEVSYPDSGIPVNANPPTVGAENAVRIDLPFAEGTNLLEKYLQINVGNGTIDTCSSPFTEGYAPGTVETATVTLAGLTWKREHQIGVAAGNIYEFTAYTTARNDICVSLSFVLHSGNIGNYATPPAEFDQAAESAVFEQIVQTFHWLP